LRRFYLVGKGQAAQFIKRLKIVAGTDNIVWQVHATESRTNWQVFQNRLQRINRMAAQKLPSSMMPARSSNSRAASSVLVRPQFWSIFPLGADG
jgi:hypothetical protein